LRSDLERVSIEFSGGVAMDDKGRTLKNGLQFSNYTHNVEGMKIFSQIGKTWENKTKQNNVESWFLCWTLKVFRE
jgi:hypothetical protein